MSGRHNPLCTYPNSAHQKYASTRKEHETLQQHQLESCHMDARRLLIMYTDYNPARRLNWPALNSQKAKMGGRSLHPTEEIPAAASNLWQIALLCFCRACTLCLKPCNPLVSCWHPCNRPADGAAQLHAPAALLICRASAPVPCAVSMIVHYQKGASANPSSLGMSILRAPQRLIVSLWMPRGPNKFWSNL